MAFTNPALATPANCIADFSLIPVSSPLSTFSSETVVD